MNGFIVAPGRVVVGAAWPGITDTDLSGRLASQSARDFWVFSDAHSVIGRPCRQPIKPLCPAVLF